MSGRSRATVFAAVDLGAGSGRVFAGTHTGESVSFEELHRFPSTTVARGDILRWDVRSMFEETIKGLSAVARFARDRGARFAGIGVDAWGVDYALISGGEPDLDDVRHHRSAGVDADAYARLAGSAEQRYRLTGVLDQRINTLAQLRARADAGTPAVGAELLFIPDLWVRLLSGSMGTEPTIASTSQLLQIDTGTWSPVLHDALGIGAATLPNVCATGTFAGPTTREITTAIGATDPIPVYRVAEHDTASALAFAQPARRGGDAPGLVSSGTWSIAGVSVAEPVVTPDAAAAGFTTERGLQGHLLLRNLSGMWLLQQSVVAWNAAGASIGAAAVVESARDAITSAEVIDPADPRLLEPGDMPERIALLAVEAGRPRPRTPADVARVILDSLAAAYCDTVAGAARLAGVTLTGIHIVGGGSQASLLCELTAQRSGLPVTAGPVEAAVIGNVVAQLVASGTEATAEDAYERVGRNAGVTVVLPSEATTTGSSR